MHWPLRADLIRRAYPATGRGRAYAAVAAAETCSAILGVWLFGWAQQQDARAYVWLYPLAGGCSIFGALLAAKFAAAVCDPHHASADRMSRRRSGFRRLVRVSEAFRAVRVTFRRDPDFFRFERAYMAYGGGWMICFALIPHLVKDKLHLDWSGIALFSQNAMQIFLLLGMLPLGRLADRWGPIRLSAFLFAGLSLYPLGLCLAADGPQLAYVSAGYGLLMAGVHITWNLGPLTLAPTPLKAPLYAAVHTTMVGVRSLLMQPLGVLLFVVSGGFTLPLLVASACFAVGSLGMFRLAKRKARALRLGQTPTVPDAAPRVA
jgi:MFS family permease